MTDNGDFSEAVEYPVNGILDLHQFKPRDVRDVVKTYVEECDRRGLTTIYVIHGKGKGVLRNQVHAVLKALPCVSSFEPAPEQFGGWGATIVYLGKQAVQPSNRAT